MSSRQSHHLIIQCYRKQRGLAAAIALASVLNLTAMASLKAAPSAVSGKPGATRGNTNGNTPTIRTLAPKDQPGDTTNKQKGDLLKQWEPGEVKTTAKQPAKPAATTIKHEAIDEEMVKLLSLDKRAMDLRQVADNVNKLRRAITDAPSSPSLRFKAGIYLYLMGDLEGAINELKTCVSLQPDHAPARAQLAKILDMAGDHSEALAQFRKAEELGPGVAEIHYLFAESLMHEANESEAINEYRKAIAIKPDADSYSGLSEALLAANDPLGATKASRQAVAIDPSLARAQVALTNALLKSGDAQASLRTARQAALLNPTLPESHLALGRCLFTKGDLTGAVEEFKQAVSLDPLNFQARNDLGYALYRQGDIPSAITEFQLALRLNPHFVEAKNNLEVAIHSLYSEGNH